MSDHDQNPNAADPRTPDTDAPKNDHAGLVIAIICGGLLLLVIAFNASC